MTERVFELDGFLGLDKSNSPYDVKKNRAVEMNNLISVDGVNRKRNGFRERAALKGRINGIWRYSELGREVFIVHAGTGIYRVALGENSLTSASELIYSGVSDSKSWGLIDANVLYILAGDYLAYGYNESSQKYEIVSIFDSQYAYIPTTTVSIDPEGAADKTRSDFESANLLTKKRKNTLQLAGTGSENNELNRTFYLDSDINEGQCVEIEIEHLLNGIPAKTVLKTRNIGSKFSRELYLVEDNALTNTPKGRLDYGVGKIVFFDAYTPVRDGEDSVIVTFEPGYADGADRITNCSFGTQFGLNGNNDRLFLAGNQLYPNLDFYSASYNYMYFPVDNYTVFGGEQSAITGYSRINDGSLGIHKGEGDTSGIYYRTAATQTYSDATTGVTLTETVFPVKAGAVGEYCIDWRSCKRLGSDPLFASRNGVYSIIIGSSVTSNERYAKERSENVNSALTAGVGLVSAIAEVIDNRYMLFVGNECYIADARYKYSDSKNADDAYNYEWWRWTLPGAITAVCKSGNILLIGAEDGKIYSLGSGYKDVEYSQSFAVTFGVDNEIIISAEARAQIFGDKTIAKIAIYGSEISDRKVTEYFARLEADGAIRLYDDQKCAIAAAIAARPTNAGCAEVIEQPVTSVFKSPLINLGSSIALKTISALYAVIDPITNTECRIRLETAARCADIGFNLIGTFDFGDVDFNDFSFGAELFTRTTMRRLNIRNANYIQFTIASSTARDSVVNKLGITYSIIKQGKGGRI